MGIIQQIPTKYLHKIITEEQDKEISELSRKINIPWLEAKHYYFQSGEESFK